MPTSFKISVSTNAGTSPSSREQATALFLNIPESAKKILIDFANVSYVSRSFSDQFLKCLKQLDNKFSIATVNANQAVSHMLSAVSHTQGVSQITLLPYTIHSFSNKEELKDYLFSID